MSGTRGRRRALSPAARALAAAGGALLLGACGRIDDLTYHPETTPEQWCDQRPCVQVGGTVQMTAAVTTDPGAAAPTAKSSEEPKRHADKADHKTVDKSSKGEIAKAELPPAPGGALIEGRCCVMAATSCMCLVVVVLIE